jgi:L-alanine-DL-glutamate epimerase-like enolase superfamily enzyme
MIIERIETFPLRIPFKPGSRSDAAVWGGKNLAAADSLLVKVTTDQGIEGWGEAFGFDAVKSVKLAVEDLIAPICIGQDATQIAPLMLQVQKKLHIFGRNSPLMFGISAIDIALWDIAGKIASTPLYRLLGGGAADLPCYASLVRCSDPALVRTTVRRAIDSGFCNLKLHETELSAVRAARAVAGSDVGIALDVNCAWTLSEARTQAKELEELRLKWLEEPVWPPENFDGLAKLRKARNVAIAAGENASSLAEFERLISAQAVDFVQPSPAKMGGVTELRKVFSIASVNNVVVMPHSFYDGPGLLAAMHASAALGTTDTMVEWRCFDLEAQLYGGVLRPSRDRIFVPQGPGLGIDPDPGVLHAYAMT